MPPVYLERDGEVINRNPFDQNCVSSSRSFTSAMMNLLSLGLFLFCASSVLASPPRYTQSHDLLRRQAGPLTTDNTCGGTKGFVCDASLELGGPCCSSKGFCG